MQNGHFEAYQEKYRDVKLKMDSYLIRRMNLIANQTVVRLGDYNLIGALAMISFTDAQLLAVLSPNETSHFNRFNGKPSTLVLAFDKPGIKEPVRFHLRVSLIAITPLPERPNICLISLTLKLIPPEFMVTLCDLFDDVETRKQAYESMCGEMMQVDPKDFQVAAIKPRGEFAAAGTRCLVDIKALSSCRADIVFGEWPFKEALPDRVSLKLIGISGSFVVVGAFEGSKPAGPGPCSLKLDLSNELIYNLEEWKTRIAIRSRAAKVVNPPR
jgi:hypothetical protein